MSALTHRYFAALCRQLHLEPRAQNEIVYELQSHVEEKTRELIEAGVSSEEALDHALNGLGPSGSVANEFYAVHSRVSWHHTALAVLPHILISLMFALHLWSTPLWVVLMLVVAVAISAFGWRMGPPKWTYPWLGYCLVAPVVSWGLAMSAVGYGAWGVLSKGSLPLSIPIYVASFLYIALSLWVVIKIVSRVARPDWVMASITVLPIPFLAYWFFYFYNASETLTSSAQPLHEVDSSAAIVFLVLAAATALFFRVGRRVVRVALLVITAPSMIILAWLSYQSGPGYVAVFLFSTISLLVLLSPALLDIKGGRPDPEEPILRLGWPSGSS